MMFANNLFERKINFSMKLFILIAMVTFLSACGGGSGNDGPSELNPSIINSDTSTALEGAAVKGIIQQGIVTVYKVENQAGFFEKSLTPLTGSVRTDINGNYNLSLAKDETGPLIIEITADDKTTMVCDVSAGCKKTSGAIVKFGDSFSLPIDFKMEAALDSVSSGSKNSAFITPLTHMAVALARTQPTGLSGANIQQGYSNIEQSLGLVAGTLKQLPPDLTKLSEQPTVTPDVLKAAVLSATFLDMVDSTDTSRDTISEVIALATAVVTKEGKLPVTQTAGSTDISVGNLLSKAQTVATGIASESSSAGAVVTTLTTIATGFQEIPKVNVVVNVPVSIVTQPSNLTVIKGSAIRLSVTATGTGPLSYQWVKDGNDLSGETASSLSVSSSDVLNAGVYSVNVTNVVGTLASTSANVVVNVPVAITKQPESVAVQKEGAVTLSVNATGTELKYQWMKDDVDLSGATGASLNIDTTKLANAGAYAVKVSNVVGAVTSAKANVTYLAASITSQPLDVTVTKGASISLSVSATGTGPLNYQWMKGGVDITGETAATLSILASDTANAGVYTVNVTNVAGTLASASATVVVNVPVAIATQPSSVTLVKGNSILLLVMATGTGPLSYQWVKDGVDLLGETGSSLGVSASEAANAGVYSVKVTNILGTVVSSVANVVVNIPIAIALQPIDVAVVKGGTISLSVSATGTAPINYQWTKDGVDILGKTGSSLSIPASDSVNAGGYKVNVTNVVGTVESSVANVLVNIPVAITSQPSGTTVVKGQAINLSVLATGTAPFSYQWTKDGTDISGETGASLSVISSSAANAGAYKVKVTNVVGTLESALATVVVNLPVSITSSPVAVTVTKRQAITLSVTVDGTAPITYQWTKGGVNIPGAISSSYSIGSAALTDTGDFSVKVNNIVGIEKPTLPAKVVVLDRDVNLTWSLPTTRADGSALAPSEISSFIIHYGTSSTSLPKTVEITDGAITTKDFLDLAAGTYYFQIATKDIYGLQSDFSAIKSKSLL